MSDPIGEEVKRARERNRRRKLRICYAWPLVYVAVIGKLVRDLMAKRHDSLHDIIVVVWCARLGFLVAQRLQERVIPMYAPDLDMWMVPIIGAPFIYLVTHIFLRFAIKRKIIGLSTGNNIGGVIADIPAWFFTGVLIWFLSVGLTVGIQFIGGKLGWSVSDNVGFEVMAFILSIIIGTEYVQTNPVRQSRRYTRRF